MAKAKTRSLKESLRAKVAKKKASKKKATRRGLKESLPAKGKK